MLQTRQSEITEAPETKISTTASADASQVRVTPEELTQALNALQASKEEEASQLNGTLSIGQAVDEMGLDSTPEEIWKQIQTQRLQEEQEARQKQEAEELRHQQATQKLSLGKQAEAVAAGIAAGKLAFDAAHVAQHRPSRAIRRSRHRGGPFLVGLIALGCFFVFGGHSVMINDDGTTTTLSGNHSIAMINGDSDKITFSGNCDVLIVNGDNAHLTINGRVKHIITNGDYEYVIWSTANNPEVPSRNDNGESNRFDVFSPDSQ